MRCLKKMTLSVRQPCIILLYFLLAVSTAYGVDPLFDWQSRMERDIMKMREEAARLHKASDKVWKIGIGREEVGGRPVEIHHAPVQTPDIPKNADERPTKPAKPDDNANESLVQRKPETKRPGRQDVPYDDANTVVYLTKAAEHGDAHAQCVLGTMYVLGQGVPKDEARAVQLYEDAAVQNNADAQYALGWLYANGRGVPRDEVKAVQWCLKAADQGRGTRAACRNLRHSAKRMPER